MAVRFFPPDPSVYVEDYLITTGNKVSALNIKSASRVNKTVVDFLSEGLCVYEFVKSGLTINDEYFPVFFSSNPLKVVLSNIPLFIKNEMLTGNLTR